MTLGRRIAASVLAATLATPVVAWGQGPAEAVDAGDGEPEAAPQPDEGAPEDSPPTDADADAKRPTDPPESDAGDTDAASGDAEALEPEPPPQADEPVDDVEAPESDDPAIEDEPFDAAPGIEDTAYDPTVDSPEAIEARQYTRGGIVMLSIGGALVIGSIALAASDPCARTAGNSCQAEARNRAAATMGIPGALILVGGTALLTAGLLQRRNLRASMNAGRTGFGLHLTGRF